MELSSRLRTLRTSTLKVAAAQIGCSVANLSQIERGVKYPSLPMCQKIANAYGLTLAQLFEDVEID